MLKDQHYIFHKKGIPLMQKIRIITDSASDITASSREDLTVLPMRISFNDEEYLDGKTITHREFYEKLIENDILPVTSLIPPIIFEEEYRKSVDKGETVLVITISSKLSGTHQSAVLAAEKFGGRVFVVDSLNATIGEQILIQYAFEMIDQGADIEKIIENLEKAKHKIHIIALLDTLEYLKKGGRISKTAAFVGGALSIKPVVTVSKGEVVLLGKARGSKNGNNFLIKEIEKVNGVDFHKPFCLGYTGLNDSLLQKYIKDSEFLWVDYAEKLPVCSVGATIGTHVGPNAIVVAFFDKTR